MPVLPQSGSQEPKHTGSTLRDRLLAACVRLVIKHPSATLICCSVLAIFGALIAVTGLRIDADTNSLIGDDRPFMQEYEAFMDEFGDLEAIHVVVDAGDPPRRDAAAAAVEDLLERVRMIDGVISAHGRISPLEQWRLATRSLSKTELEELADAAGVFSLVCSDRSTASLFEEVDARLGRLLGAGLLMDEDEARILGSETFFLLRLLCMQAAFQEPRYLSSSTDRMYFIEVMPRKDFGSLSVIDGPLASIRDMIEEVAARHPSITIGLTGKPVLQADEMATTESDMTRASIIALALITLLFMTVFRGIRRPLFLVLAFLVAFGWTYGLVTLLIGRLNLLSIVFMLVMVGVGVDYGIHVLSAWVEARRVDGSERAVRRVLARTMPGNITGAVTSAGVFLLALLTDFQGLRELGLIAGVGLMLCLVAMSMTLPSLLHRFERNRPVDGGGRWITRTDSIAPNARGDKACSRSPLGLLGLAVALLGAVIFAFLVPGGLRFQSNLLELQADGLDSVGWERRLFEDDSSTSWFAAVVVDSIEEIQEVVAQARKHPEIGPVRSVLDIVSPPSSERGEMRERISLSIPTVEPEDRVRDSPGIPPSSQVLERIAGRLVALERLAGSRAGSDRLPPVRPVAERLLELSATFESDDDSTRQAGIRDLESARSDAADALFALGTGASGSLRQALPTALKDRFISPNGRYMVMLQPAEDVWSMEAMRPFITALRSVDDAVTGVPITQYESMIDMTRAFAIMVVGAICLVAFMIWLDFRSLTLTLACMATLLTGMLWTLGLMMIIGIPLNLANFFAIPILIGLGCDGAIHVTHRWRRIVSRVESGFGATIRAVVLTTGTTCLGFAALFTAEHQGLRSLGGVMVVGSVCCLVATVLVLPGLLARLPGSLDDPAADRRGHEDPTS